MSEDFVCSLLGSGSQEDPWKITSEKDMLEVQGNLEANNGYEGEYFLITQNITLGRKEPWSTDEKAWGGLGMAAIKDNKDTHSPYATKAAIGFAGTLDGGGYVITVHRTADNVSGVGGLVNYLAPSGIVKNVTMVGTLTVTGGNIDAVGGVVGYNSGTIQNVTNQVVVTAIGAYNVGGIAGFNNGYYNLKGEEATEGDEDNPQPKGEIEHCMNHASIMGYAKVGGITGEDSGFIDICANIADNIYGENASKDGVGGIAGRNGDNNVGAETGKIENCYNTGNIQDQQGSWIGGITGFQDVLSSIANCYSIGKVVGYSYRDNIAGDNENKTDGVVNSYGEKNEKDEPINGAQHYDDATLLTKEQIESVLANQLNGNARTGVWTQTQGEIPYLVNCGNKMVEIDPAAFVINVVANPNALTYVAGESFERYGLVIQAIYEDGKRETIDPDKYANEEESFYPSGPLGVDTPTIVVAGSYKDIGFSFIFTVDVVDTPSGKVILGDGEAGYWATLNGAIAAAKIATGDAKDKINVADTISLPNGTYNGEDGTEKITIQRYDGGADGEAFENIIFKIATNPNYDTDAYVPQTEDGSGQRSGEQEDPTIVTLENMILEGTTGAASAPMIQVDSGTLTLGSKVTLENNQIPDTSTDSSEDSSKHVSAKEGSWSGFKNDAQRGAGVSIHGGTVNCQGEVSGCDTLEGGGFSVSAGALNLTGKITGCTGTNGSAIYQQGGKVTIKTGASITENGNNNTEKGTILVTCGDRDETSEFVVDGGSISKNTAKNGSIVYVEGGKATIQGSSTLSGKAAAVYVTNQYIMKKGKLDKTVTGLLTISSGTISREQDTKGNTRVTDSDSRALVVIDGGEVKLNGGAVQDRICVENDLVVADEETGAQELIIGKLYLSGGTVGGDAEDVAVNINGGECVMIGGEVDGSEDPVTSSSQAICVDCVSMKMKEAQGDTVKTVTKIIKGKFTIHAGTVSGGNASAAVNINGGEATMEGGKIEAGTNYGVRVAGMDIMDGQTKATETVVGSFLMKNGKINGSTTAPAVVVCGGEFTWNGGAIKALDEEEKENENGIAIRVTGSETSKFVLNSSTATVTGKIELESGAKLILNVVPGAVLNVTSTSMAKDTVIAVCSNPIVAGQCLNKIVVEGATLELVGNNIVIKNNSEI